MPDKSHNRVHIMWLHLLRDLRETGEYSWGSACLATLYRELCRASEPGVMSFGGCSHLLQTWAWYHMSFLAPISNFEPRFPFAKRYSGKGMKFGDTPRYHTDGYRSKIDHMTVNDFIWRPYLHLTYDHPEDNWLWNASTYLICFYIIEMHQTDRVKLQFGLPQEIPHPPRNMKKYHKVDLHKQVDYSWALFYENENKEWNERENHILHGQPLNVELKPSYEYMVWFCKNSKRFISVENQLVDPRANPPQPPPQSSQHFVHPQPPPQSSQFFFHPQPPPQSSQHFFQESMPNTTQQNQYYIPTPPDTQDSYICICIMI
ncbi:serine/threonine-protein phosphatase 7 long form homolog [Cicer arietinum]|uniref:serine/threonine-protein phosphatase 7 long form homolog n=1 Tax=Cicer arietinum TaxID=3827 RepID=UPI003CC5B938